MEFPGGVVLYLVLNKEEQRVLVLDPVAPDKLCGDHALAFARIADQREKAARVSLAEILKGVKDMLSSNEAAQLLADGFWELGNDGWVVLQ
jgi:hypothetical protein